MGHRGLRQRTAISTQRLHAESPVAKLGAADDASNLGITGQRTIYLAVEIWVLNSIEPRGIERTARAGTGRSRLAAHALAKIVLASGRE